MTIFTDLNQDDTQAWFETVNGGEGGIRTLGTGPPVHLLSRQPRSATPAPLRGNTASSRVLIT